MKIFSRILLVAVFVLGPFLLFTVKVDALTINYPYYNVEVDINEDSTLNVTERVSYVVNGEFHGIRRDIPLDNPNRENCINTNQTCGGFDRLQVTTVSDLDGDELSAGQYSVYQFSENGIRYLRIEREIYADGKNVSDYRIGWIINYKVYGSIQKVGGAPFFYWNMLPSSKGGSVDSTKITLNFPSSVNLSASRLQVFADYVYTDNVVGNTFTADLANLSSRGDFTIAYQFNNGEITLPGNLAYTILSPHYSNKIYLDGLLVSESEKGVIKSVESGQRTLRIDHIGYKPYVKTLTIEPGETLEVTTSLEPETWMSLLLSLNSIIFIIGCVLVPGSVIFIILHHRAKGRDLEMPKTIIPLFSPPENIRPYLLGTMKDEQVDKEDITGSIIDLAYRGFIKIKELKANENYELTRLEGKEGEKLEAIEEELLDGLFRSKTVVETQHLRSYFLQKYLKLETTIYKEVVARGYFARSPRTTIGFYAGCGITVLIAGIILTIALSIVLTSFLGYFTIFSPTLALSVLGLGLAAIAKFMPAKTPSGSKLLAGILGFKMYLHTAERYRLQELGPDEFERYLAYAVVFKIEKEWAKKFEGIYNKVPDWYEGSGNVYDAIWISTFARSFSNSTVSNMTPVTSSASGGGWSGGGGSFGGFSGGGGGGGSSGGW